MINTDLKHLTLKTAFLLALSCGKCCSKIHALVANKVSNLDHWEKVILFPSSYFIAKNQLSREGSQSVSLETITALTTILDRQFKDDRTLCTELAAEYRPCCTIWIEPKILDPYSLYPSRKDVPQTSTNLRPFPQTSQVFRSLNHRV